MDQMRHSHDVIVIGAGAGGLTAAGGCAMLGLRVALIERGPMGGDCLNTGCVPSKALIAVAKCAHQATHGRELGVTAEPRINFQAVHAHVHRAIATIAPSDSQERFEGLGCEVLRGNARLTGRDRVYVNGRTLSAPRIVLAVGSRPRLPDIPGLSEAGYLTNESLFDLQLLPEHLVVLGSGPIGIEMAQAFRRLGAAVTVITHGQPLDREDPDATAVAIKAVTHEGVRFLDGTAARVEKTESGIALQLADGQRISGSHLLVATGRHVDVTGLGLEAAGVAHDRHGISVDARRRTSNPRIYAIGDCRPGPRFTHVSGYEGSNVVLEIGLGIPAKVDFRALPRVTYCDPEIAQVGLTEAEARKRHGDSVRIWRSDFDDNDRAITDGETAGFVKLVKKGRRLVGATIVGAHAGDMLMPLAMAITGKASIFAIATLIAPYPNRIEHLKKAAFASQEGLMFNRFTRKWARLLARLRL
jgi:pyruvate/2-oxoglutarate dehydrogenase complex dihydrolipoamide dehydrogenase (E3) component